jgi:hypothetical protein
MNDPNAHPSRRAFARSVAALAATPLVLSSEAAQAQTSDTTVAQSLTELARLRFGKHLTEEQLTQVRRDITRQLHSAGVLHQVKLRNSDEPAVIFRADVP